jgi:transcriptional regulator with XRE-family HTH domain
VTERHELGEFLRARRAALRPGDVGLPDSGRRRTPGLRREEVATLAGVSVDYLVRLEQGRDVNPSPSVQTALARALRLTLDERKHLAELTARTNDPEGCPVAPPLHQEIAPTVQQLLDSMDATAAFVIGPGTYLLAWNRSWERLVTPLGMLDDRPPNFARYVFRNPRARVTYPDWSTAADEQVSSLHAAELQWGDDPAFAALLEELLSVPEFAARWPTHDVAAKLRGNERLLHPDVGELSIAYEALDVPDGSGQRLITWLPADHATATAIRTALTDTAAVSPPNLRVVGEH